MDLCTTFFHIIVTLLLHYNIQTNSKYYSRFRNDFSEVYFKIVQEYPAAEAAFRYGKKYNAGIVTRRSDKVRGILKLTCKHAGVLRVGGNSNYDSPCKSLRRWFNTTFCPQIVADTYERAVVVYATVTNKHPVTKVKRTQKICLCIALLRISTQV